jgi:general L-amino acid transport system permease protein
MTARHRDLAIQGAVLAIIAAIGVFLIHNLISNLHRLGIVTGFGFLSASAGFDVSFRLFHFDAASSYATAFLIGLSNTLLVSAIGIVLCTVIGVCVGVARWSRVPILADLGAIYVELFRNVPLLLQVFFWYFGVLRALPSPAESIGFGDVVFLNNRGLWLPAPIVSSSTTWLLGGAETAFISGAMALRVARRRRVATGRRSLWFVVGWGALAAGLATAIVSIATIDWDIARKTRFGLRGGMEIVPEFASLLAALSIYFGSYAAENVRAGLDGVSAGQLEAARALGLTFWQSLRRVALPQALRGILPPLTGVWLTLVKASAIGAAIAFPELSQIGTTTLNQTGDALAVSFILVAAYLSINVSISLALGVWEQRLRRRIV